MYVDWIDFLFQPITIEVSPCIAILGGSTALAMHTLDRTGDIILQIELVILYATPAKINFSTSEEQINY